LHARKDNHAAYSQTPYIRHQHRPLDLLAAHPEIDLVVTDVQMPGETDGLKLVDAMTHIYPNVRTLVTSGRASPYDARQCGANKFLAKPYSALALQTAVQKTLLNH
jgi:CheY-like chemotaxis protein